LIRIRPGDVQSAQRNIGSICFAKTFIQGRLETMRTSWKRFGAASGLLLILVLLAPGCVIRAHGHIRPLVVVDEAPPPPRENVEPAPRAGQVWVRGYWQHHGGRWHWQRGHWQRARHGHVWVAGHWEQRGNRHHWVDGHWRAGGGIDTRDHRPAPTPAPAPAPPPAPVPAPVEPAVVDVYVDVAPPAAQAENPGQNAGHVWATGRWEWRNGRWKWKRGHWVKLRTGFQWVAGHWEQRGARHYWIEGSWAPVGSGIRTRDHRRR
jgi:hypothetical protein